MASGVVLIALPTPGAPNIGAEEIRIFNAFYFQIIKKFINS